MKTIFTPLFWLFVVSTAICQENRNITYFVPRTLIESDEKSKIEINKNNDTTFVAYFYSTNPVNNISQDITKIYKGTPFYKNGWYKGKIYSTNNQVMEFSMAYNIQQDLIYIVDGITKQTFSRRPNEFSLQGHNFKLYDNSYYEPLHSGSLTLLKKQLCILKDLKTNMTTGYGTEGGESDFDGNFSKSVKYFFYDGDKVQVLPKFKNLSKIFGDKKDFVQKYIEAEGIKFKSEDEIIKIFKYFDSISTF